MRTTGGRRHRLRCLSLLAAVCAGQLVAPGAVTTGGGGRRRSGGYVRVKGPPAGFFVAGSSIAALNGVYERITDEADLHGFAESLNIDPASMLRWGYCHDSSEWAMINVRIPASGEKAYTPVGGGSFEWIFLDSTGRHRFGHDGLPLIPGSGTNWEHLHRSSTGRPASDADGLGSEPDAYGNASNQSSWTGGGGAIAIAQDDETELPWQLIGITHAHMVHQMRERKWSHDRHVFSAASRLPAPPSHGSKERAPPGEAALSELPWMRRANESFVAGECSAGLEHAMREASGWAEALVLRCAAACFRRLRNFVAAEAAVDASLRLFPQYTAGIFEKAVLRLDEAKYEEARQSLELLLRIDRDYAGLLDWLVLAHAHARRADHLRRDDESRAEETRRQKLAQQMAQARCADSEAAAPGASGGETVLQGPRVQADGQGTANGADAAPTSSGPDQRGFCSADDVRVLREALADEPRAALDARWRSGDHYHVLGVPHDAAETELKRAYRQLSLRLHPDRPAGDERAFARVAAAFETLSDDKLRRAYHDGEAEDRKTSNNWRGDVDMPLREQMERRYFPAEFDAFEPFGDPLDDFPERRAQRRELRRRSRVRAVPVHLSS